MEQEDEHIGKSIFEAGRERFVAVVETIFPRAGGIIANPGSKTRSVLGYAVKDLSTCWEGEALAEPLSLPRPESLRGSAGASPSHSPFSAISLIC